MHKHLSIGLLALSLLTTATPVIAQEDEELGDAPSVSLEEMLLQEALSGQRHIDGRMSQRIQALQEKQQLEKLAAMEAALLAAQSSSSAGVQHAAASEEETYEEDIPTVSANGLQVTDGTQTITLDAATFRMLARLQNRTQYANPALHSGAPLAPTGPGTILAVFAMALAVGFTYLRAWMLEKKNRE